MGKIILASLFLLFGTAGLYAATSQDYYQAGAALYQQGQYDKAIQYFKAATQLDPANWQAYQYLGTAYLAKGDKAGALDAFDKSLQLNANNAELKKYVEQLRPTVTPPSSPEVEIVDNKTASPAARINPALAQSHFFLKGMNSFNFNQLPDLNYAYRGSPSAGVTAKTGMATTPQAPYYSYQGEIGYAFDPYNAVGIGWEAEANSEFSLYNDTQTVFKNFTPSENGILLNYYRFIPDKDGRWIGRVGIGYYNINLTAFDSTTPGLTRSSYTLSTGTIGGSVSVEREFMLFWVVGLDLSVGYKYADATKMTTSYAGGTLAYYKNSTGYIGLVDDSQIGTGGLQYGSVDYSGFNFGFGLEFDL